MVSGKVNKQKEPFVTLRIFGKRFKVIVDTGFSGSLWVPDKFLWDTNFQVVAVEPFMLANGEIVYADVGFTTIRWLGEKTKTRIIVSEGKDILLGTELLEKTKLEIDFVKKKVIIEKIV